MTIREISSAAPGLLPEWAAKWRFPQKKKPMQKHLDLAHIRHEKYQLADADPERVLLYLIKNGAFSRCLSIEEGNILIETNQLSDPIFQGQHLLMWRSIVVDHDDEGKCFIPFIQNIPGQPRFVKPVIYWHWFGYPLRSTQGTFTYAYPQ